MIKEQLDKYLQDLVSGSANKRYHANGFIDANKIELIQLAKLGLWARDVGVPALQNITRKLPALVSREEAADMAMEFKQGSVAALIAMPKDITK